MKTHINLTVFGKVQGVGFRYQVKGIADSLNIFGYIRNMNDGSVYIEAEGNTEILREFLAIIKSSPGISRIDNIDVEEGALDNYRDFTVY